MDIYIGYPMRKLNNYMKSFQKREKSIQTIQIYIM